MRLATLESTDEADMSRRCARRDSDTDTNVGVRSRDTLRDDLALLDRDRRVLLRRISSAMMAFTLCKDGDRTFLREDM